MMFKKGSFEIGATIYPVAIKVFHVQVFSRTFLFQSARPHCTSIYSLSVRPKVRRRFLEQFQVQHGQLPAEDDDQLGPGPQRLVPAGHAPTGVYEHLRPITYIHITSITAD